MFQIFSLSLSLFRSLARFGGVGRGREAVKRAASKDTFMGPKAFKMENKSLEGGERERARV
jgi:hypothetical protein